MSSDPTVKNVKCPLCNEKVTIYYENRDCPECGENISEINNEINQRIHTIKHTVKDIIQQSQLELQNISKQGDVIQCTLQADGPLLLDSIDIDSDDMESVLERQEKLSDLRNKLESVEDVIDTEVFYGEESKNTYKSKYGINIENLIFSDEDVVLLIGTNVNIES